MTGTRFNSHVAARVCAALLSLVLVAPALANTGELPADREHSVMWPDMVKRFFSGGPVVFDERVSVMAPASAEDQFNVPITVDAREIPDAVEIVAVADLNPIPLILRAELNKADAYLGFRIKLQQTSAIHVGVRDASGRWHMGSTTVDAAGGGCTAPAMAHGQSNWADFLGQARQLALRERDGSARLRFKVQHPMDTGLADGIPAFYLNELAVRDERGETLMNLELYEPVSENPALTLKPQPGLETQAFYLAGRDIEGNEFGWQVPLQEPRQ